MNNSNSSSDKTREAWLQRATVRLVPLIDACGVKVPEKVHVSVGFPKGTRGRQPAIGQCFHKEASADAAPHVFICPTQGDAARVLDILAHELIHTATQGAGHKGEFVRVAKAVGLKRPWTATTAGEELGLALRALAAELGPYPHAVLTPGGKRAKSSNRQFKFVCGCGTIARHGYQEFEAVCRKLVDGPSGPRVCNTPFLPAEKKS